MLSMTGGFALSPDRWYWAVLTTYLVFLGARSRGDTIFKGVQRLWGTLIGLVVGVVASVALSGHTLLEILGILACVFTLAYVFAISQTLAIFSVTILLGLVYSLIGSSAETILMLRLEETAIGAAAATLVGLLVLPRRTHDLVHDTGSQLLRALARTVRLSAARLKGQTGDDPVAAMREADRQFRDLRAALRPLQASRALVWWARAPAELPAILACMFWVRALISASREECAPALGEQATRLADRLDAIAGSNEHHLPARSGSIAAVNAPAPPQARAGLTLTEAALVNLASILDVMHDRFAVEGWDALITKRPI